MHTIRTQEGTQLHEQYTYWVLSTYVYRLARTYKRICKTQASWIRYLSLPQQTCHLSSDNDISQGWNKKTFEIWCHKIAFNDQISKLKKQVFENKKHNNNYKHLFKMWGNPKLLKNRFFWIIITKREKSLPMKKVIIMTSGIVLKEYLPYLLNLCTGINTQNVPLNSCRNLFKV